MVSPKTPELEAFAAVDMILTGLVRLFAIYSEDTVKFAIEHIQQAASESGDDFWLQKTLQQMGDNLIRNEDDTKD